MTYRIAMSTRASKDLRKLPSLIRQKVDAAIDVLRVNPFLGKRLHAEFNEMWSLRVWPYRIIYTIHREIVTVTILRIGHRQGVYRK